MSTRPVDRSSPHPRTGTPAETVSSRTPNRSIVWRVVTTAPFLLSGLVPPVGARVGAVLAARHDPRGAFMVLLSVISGIWYLAAYLQR